MSHLKKAAFGCLGIIVIGALLIGLLGAIVAFSPEPDFQLKTARRELPLGPAESPPTGVVIEPSSTPTMASRKVRLELSKGEFEIRAAAPGESLRVEAEYDESAFALETEVVDGDVLRIKYDETLGFFGTLARIRHKQPDSKIVIYLPRGVPIELDAKLSMGQSTVDLTGISLTNVDFDLAMGEHKIRFDKPNPVSMQHFFLRGKAGEFVVRHLGHAGPKVIDIDGKMGDYRLYFGELDHDTAVSLRLRAGDMRVELPDDIDLELGKQKVAMGALNVRQATQRNDDELAGMRPRMTLDVDVKMGELRAR